MKVKNSFIVFFVALTIFFGACSNPADSGPSNNPNPGSVVESPGAVSRYVAVPHNGSNNDRIKYSYAYDGYDFYYIYLGELKNIPMFYVETEYHTKGNDFTYSFSQTEATEDKVSKTVSNSSQTVKSVTDEHTKSKTSSQQLGVCRT